MSASSSLRVQIVEVGVRDGLQNESKRVSTFDKLELIKDLVEAGVKSLEVGSWVRADKVPQMADTPELLKYTLSNFPKIQSHTLVPNLKGLQNAMAELEIKNIAVFTAATDSFAKKNIGMTVKESLSQISQIIKIANQNKISVRGYVSTAFGCPFEGKTKPKKALQVIEALLDLGVYQVSIGDTIGVACPNDIGPIFKPLLNQYKVDLLAGHFHDTRGTALANTLKALELGVRHFDSSMGGLGGCPFAPGAAGNLATEDLLYMLGKMGFKTGINLEKLCRASHRFLSKTGLKARSKYLLTYQSQCKTKEV